MKTFNLKFLAADKFLYDGPCKGIVVPISDGEYGILPGHLAMLSTIVPGKIKALIDDEDIISFINKKGIKGFDIDSIKDEAGEKIIVVVEQGIVEVKGDNVIIAVDSAEFIPEIDLNRALRAEQKAKEKLLNKQSKVEYKLTQAAIARALNRIKAKH